ALHGPGVAPVPEIAGEAAHAAGVVEEVVVGLVVGAADADIDVGAVVRAPAQVATEHLLPVVGLVAAEHAAVVLVERIGHQRMALHVHGLSQLAATAQAHRRVAVAVAVGLVGEAARTPAFGG